MAARNLNDQTFEIQVVDALEHLWDFAYLGRHPLAQLKCVLRRLHNRSEMSHVDVGRALSEILLEAIEKMKQTKGQGDFSREKYYYTILTMAYLQRIKNKTIAESLSIGERTLYRHSLKAVQAITQILLDWEK